MTRNAYSAKARTRREFCCAALWAGLWLGVVEDCSAASDFWNRKEPAAWSTDEIIRLATKSPWARNARVLPRPHRDRGTVSNVTPELSGNNSELPGNVKLGEVGAVPVEEVTVIWASGKPIVDALKTRFPADFANHYVIGINDLPKAEGGRTVDPDGITATLQLHGGKSVGAGGIIPGKDTTLFAFSKELFPLSVDDKEVLFSLETSEYTIKTYFNLREMMYHGKLAV